ncbi:MAG: molecular chaperone HtpG [Saprospiraceae bacterium]|nr:molecular chaperone HtpG [Saprospiraceae bacterium]
MRKGSISVETENIFPIIKQFLYSDQEIFLRELIANATDATNKLLTLSRRGEVSEEVTDTTIKVSIDADAKTLTISDRGIGMTEEEVIKYLNQVAFSSAKEFVEKYKEEASIIGHFGLGFYSSFMVADKVEVLTKSYKKDSVAVKWTCTGNTDYEIEDIEKENYGTDIVLHISEESAEYLQNYRISEMLNKHCKFLPIEIEFGTRTEYLEDETITKEDGTEEKKSIEVPNIINNTNPAWKKQPSELTDEEYQAFYRELHPTGDTPLFWVHLNIDYPFNLTGILYFPKLGNQLEIQRNKIHLYSNQVYVTDEVKEIVPEFLTLLHGVIDSPDIPLNVSRSYLQSDRNVKKITDYITKKVADRLDEMFRKEREEFEAKWENMGVFVKYGFVTEEKFADKAQTFLMLENVDADYFTIEEYQEKVGANQIDKDDKTVIIYTNNKEEHDSYIQGAKELGYDVLNMETMIDVHFIQALERKLDKVTFVRVDSDTADKLIDKGETRESVLSEEEQKSVEEIFNKCVNAQGASVKLEALSPNDLPILITRPEFMRRMQEMSAMQGMTMNMGDMFNVVVNTNHEVVGNILKDNDESKAQHLFDLARLHNGMLKGSELTDFIKNSVDLMK